MEIKADNQIYIWDAPEAGCVLSMPGLPGGGGRVFDRSVYGNTGTLNGAGWTRTPGGIWGLQFDGVDDNVQCGDNPSLDIVEDITILLWVKRIALNRREILVVKRLVGVNDCNYEFEIANDPGYANLLYFSYQDNAGNWEPNIYSQGTVDSNWHQVGITRGARKICFYIDGRKDAAEYIPSKNMNAVNVHPLTISALSNIAYFYGSLAMLRVWRRALSALEIQNKYLAEKTLFGAW